MPKTTNKGKAQFGAFGYTNTDYPDGIASFYVASVSHGIFQNYEFAEARTTRSVYFRRVKADKFSVVLTLTSYEERRKASDFFRGYTDFVTDPNNVQCPPMVCWIPARNFAMFGVPTSQSFYGMRAGEFVWSMNVDFDAATDPLPVEENMTLPKNNNKARWFYPLGHQPGYSTDNVETRYFDTTRHFADINAPIGPALPTPVTLPNSEISGKNADGSTP